MRFNLAVQLTPFDPQFTLVTSPFFRPSLLAILRLAIALYSLVVILITLIYESVKSHEGQQYLSYFTHLSHIGLTAYFWAAGVQTAWFARRKGSYPLQSWPKILRFLHLFLLATIVTYPIIVTVVFWLLLASPTVFQQVWSTWDNVSLHMLNSVYALFEIFLTNAPPPPVLMLPLCVIALAGYLGVAYITHITQGFYTYSFLDPVKHKKTLPAYIIGIAVGECVIFGIVYLVMFLRRRLTAKHKEASRPEDSSPEKLEEWQEVA